MQQIITAKLKIITTAEQFQALRTTPQTLTAERHSRRNTPITAHRSARETVEVASQP